MGLKILHSADWHLGAAFASFSPEQRQYLLQQQKQLPGKIACLVREQGCALVLLAGDLFDGPHPGSDWVVLLKRALEQMEVPVFVSPGNHDYCCPGSPWLEETWPENVRIFTGGLTSVAVPELDCRIWGAGYSSMDCPPLLEGFRGEGPERYKIALLHGDPLHKNSPYCAVTSGQMASCGLDYLALGHVHKGGALESSGVVCAWSGCPMGRGWDETGEKGVLLVSLENSVEVTPLVLDAPRFYDLEAEEDTLPEVLPLGPSRDFYRVTLVGECRETLAQIRGKFPGFANLLLRDNREEAEDLWAEAGEDTLRGVYFSLLKRQNADLTAEISRRLLAGREVRLP